MHQSGQCTGIAFPFQDGVEYGHAADSAPIAEHGGQLDIHFRERFLHALNGTAGRGDEITPLPPQAARDTDFVGRLKAAIQQAECMQFQQPLTFLHIALASRYVLRMLRVDQRNPQPMLLENLEHRHPVHAGGLHGYGPYALLHQPPRHGAKSSRETSEPPHRLRIAIRADRYPMLAAANIDARRIRMHDLQRFPIQRFPAGLRLLARRLFPLHHSCLRLDFLRFGLGPVPMHKTKLSNGVRSGPEKRRGPPKTNVRDRMKSGATLLHGYRTPVCGRP